MRSTRLHGEAGRFAIPARVAAVAAGVAMSLPARASAVPLAVLAPTQLTSDGATVSGLASAPPGTTISLTALSVPTCARASDRLARVVRGSATVETGESGAAGFTISLANRVAAGEGVLVAAHDAARSREVESACITIGARAPATIEPPAVPVRVGGSVSLTGTNITAGTVLKVFVGTATGGFDAYPSGLAADSTTDTSWSGTLTFPWSVAAPDNISLGQGYVSLVLVRTDQGFDTSNSVGAVLLGNDALLPKVPSLTRLGGLDLSATSSDPSIHVANVEAILTPGTNLVIGGSGFTTNPLVNLYTSVGNLGPLTPNTATATSISVTVPLGAKIGPGSVQVVNQPSFRISNAVSIPIGELVTISSVTVNGNTIDVTGTGFNDDLTVVNFFAVRNGQLQNLGGLAENGVARIVLDVTSSTHLSFQRPPAVEAGKAFVEAINPPYIPFTSSGSGPGGSVVLP